MIRYQRIILNVLLIYSFSLYAGGFFRIPKNSIADLEEIDSNKNNILIDSFLLLEDTYDHDKITVYKFLDGQKSSYIVFIKDAEGHHYVVKQEKSGTLQKQIRALCETLGAYIALQTNIPSHQVKLLSLGRPFPGKFITKRIATIHTLVPGATIRTSSDSKYAKLDIKQATDKNVPFEKQGFNERTIFFMSQHPHLPKIVALDTFVNNKDRNKANILYDENTDSFYAIDMALMYDVLNNNKSVAQLACEQVHVMIEQKKRFTENEVQALSAYRSVLQQLVQKFPPKKMCELLDSFLCESGLIGRFASFNEKDVYSLLNLYKRAVRQSYIDIKKLIYLLFILIDTYS